jgi:hypothetical protein
LPIFGVQRNRTYNGNLSHPLWNFVTIPVAFFCFYDILMWSYHRYQDVS